MVDQRYREHHRPTEVVLQVALRQVLLLFVAGVAMTQGVDHRRHLEHLRAFYQGEIETSALVVRNPRQLL